jgi:hypothetical protein
MRLLMTLLVRDEEELLAANLDYHLGQGVDFVLVSDHGSRDATLEILAAYESQGLARVFHVEGEALDQGAWVTRMARLAAVEYGADWVINNDADEFWWPLAGTLKDMLALIPPRYGQLAVPRRNFIPRPGPGPFWERMVIREARSQNLVGRELEPNAIHRGHGDVVIDHGNHWVHRPPLAAGPPLPLIEVLHFPVRSWEQFEHKVARAGPGYLALGEEGREVGRDQLTLYELHRRGELPGYFASLLDEERIEAGLASGELVVDRRLERFMSSGERSPDWGAHRAAVEGMAREAFSLEQKLAEREEERNRARERLDEVAGELALLRDSRLFRWTRPLRRAWYRLRNPREGG